MPPFGRASAVVIVTLLAGCSSEPTGVNPEAAFSTHAAMVPFTAHLEGTARDPSGIVCPPGSFAGRFSMTGQATHMGHVGGHGSGCTAFTSATTFVFLAADNTLVAANGDELWLTLVGGGGSVVGFDPTTGPRLAWTAVKEVVGGTGRFAGATGRVTEVGTQDGFSAPSVAVLEGNISRVGTK